MIQGDADVEWKKTNVFVHLRRQFNVSEEATSFTLPVCILTTSLG
jgi:hypothetical protein